MSTECAVCYPKEEVRAQLSHKLFPRQAKALGSSPALKKKKLITKLEEFAQEICHSDEICQTTEQIPHKLRDTPLIGTATDQIQNHAKLPHLSQGKAHTQEK